MSNEIDPSHELNPSERICYLRVLPLYHVAEKWNDVCTARRCFFSFTFSPSFQVRPVAYVIARAQTQFRTRDNVPLSYAFPLGASVKFVVDQFDDSADKFDATSHDVILDSNRFVWLQLDIKISMSALLQSDPKVSLQFSFNFYTKT